MRIAVVGSGISGIVCAYLLSSAHEVVLFEKDSRLGGHTHTIAVEHEDRALAVDTGFIVFNERNYPSFCAFLKRLGVASRPTTMSFSMRDDASDFEYGGSSLAGVVGEWRNLSRRRWWRVMSHVATLGSLGDALLSELDESVTIGDLYASGRVSRGFLDDYLAPMAAAIWSAPQDALREFPARFVLQFFENHGMLNLRERPQWRTVSGGSKSYIDAAMPVLGPLVRTGAGVESIERVEKHVRVRTRETDERFDVVILACHSDQALAMLSDATETERAILGAMPYQANDAVLHRDERLLPKRRRCWAAWNYRTTQRSSQPVSVTYNMSMLQGLETREPLCVTLNDTSAIDPAKIIRTMVYHHPLYTREGMRARGSWSEISRVDQRTLYCGAYWGNGFHEDGVVSGLRVCERLGIRL